MYKVLLLFGAAVTAALLSLGMFIWQSIQGIGPVDHLVRPAKARALEWPASLPSRKQPARPDDRKPHL